VGITCLAGGDDHHAIVGFVLEVKKPQKGDCQFGTVGCGAAEKIRSTAMVIASVPGAEPGAADAVGGSDACKDREPGRDVEIFVPVTLVQDEARDLKVGAGGPQSAPGLGCPALCCALRERHG
jgi:hypothetical protein